MDDPPSSGFGTQEAEIGNQGADLPAIRMLNSHQER
jgi:hypothetical protein